MFKMSNSTYDCLKFVAQLLLPALATLYATVGKVWSLPYITEIPATIMAVDFFLGTILKISTDAYFHAPDEGDE